MLIQVFGPRCARCDALHEVVREAAALAAEGATIQRVRNMPEIMACDVLMVPALAIDGQVLCAGRVPDLEEVKRLIRAAGDRA